MSRAWPACTSKAPSEWSTWSSPARQRGHPRAGRRGGIADPFAGLDVESLAGLHVEGPVGVVDVEQSGEHEAVLVIVGVLSDAHPSRGRLQVGDGELGVAGVDQTDELIGALGDVANAGNDGGR